MEQSLSKQEIKTLLKTISSNRDYAIVLTLLTTGITLSELCTLAIDNVDLEKERLMVSGNKARTIPINSKANVAIARWLTERPEAKTNTLFLTAKGELKELSARSVDNLLRKAGKEAGFEIPLTSLLLRGTYAVNLFQDGATIKQVSALLGISDYNTLQKYRKMAGKEISHSEAKPPPVAKPLLVEKPLPLVKPKNILFRLESASKTEIIIFFALLGLVLLALALTKYELGSSLRSVLATPETAIAEYKNPKNLTFVEFKGEFIATKEKTEGIAEILDAENKQLVVLYEKHVYTLSSNDGADIVASKVRVKYSDKPLVLKQVVFKDKTRTELFEQLTTASLVTGYVELLADMQLKFPASDIKQGSYKSMQQKGNRLVLSYASKAEIEKLGLNEQFFLLQKNDKTVLNSLRAKKAKILSEINLLKKQNNTPTELDRETREDQLKLNKENDIFSSYRSQLKELDIKIKTIRLRIKEPEFLFTGEVKVRK